MSEIPYSDKREGRRSAGHVRNITGYDTSGFSAAIENAGEPWSLSPLVWEVGKKQDLNLQHKEVLRLYQREIVVSSIVKHRV